MIAGAVSSLLLKHENDDDSFSNIENDEVVIVAENRFAISQCLEYCARFVPRDSERDQFDSIVDFFIKSEKYYIKVETRCLPIHDLPTEKIG